MLIRPELQALRSDDAPQREAQAALHVILQDWRYKGPGRAIEAELIAWGAGEPLDDQPSLRAMFDPDADGLCDLADGLLRPLLQQMATEPLSQSPLRYTTGDAYTSLVLARHGTTVLSIQCVDGNGLARTPRPTTASFLPAETWERALSGSAEALLVQAHAHMPGKAELECTQIAIAAGEVRHRIGNAQAVLFTAASGSLVQLRLQRRTSAVDPVREYRLSDGCLVHQAAGTPRDSRLELTAALLGRMKRRDAAPMLAAMVEEHGSESLRWQCLRECLALDVAVGFPALCKLAEREGDPLQQPAEVLRAQLLARHPELKELSPCPA